MRRTYSLGLEVLLHLLFWVITTWLIVSNYSIESVEYTVENDIEQLQIIRNPDMIRMLIITLVLAAVLVYGNIFAILRFQQLKKPIRGIFLSMSILAFAIILRLLIQTAFHRSGPMLDNQVNLGILGFYFVASTGYALGRIAWKASLEREALLGEKKQAELSALRNQLQPHFLFNALNNLLAMVNQEQNPALAQAIDQLSRLLRHIVETKDPIPIREEINFLRNYASMQLLRFAPGEVDFQLTVNGSEEEQLVEPGIFIAFVENAFKYGAEPETQSVIEVNFDLTQRNRVGFQVTNPIHAGIEHVSMHTGLQDVQRRLELVYPGLHQLEIAATNSFSIHLTLITDAGNHRR